MDIKINTAQDAEQKIKEAARKIFQQKGFAATKTRDIAEEAGINLALLNYYFRSKQKLYDLIMLESIHAFFGKVMPILNDSTTTLKEKLVVFVENYIDVISENPDLPIFIINGIKDNPNDFAEKLIFVSSLKSSVAVQQFMAEKEKGNMPNINPLHFMMNLSSMVIFPFMMNPLIKAVTQIEQVQFLTLMEERKKLIPIWIESMLRLS